VGRQEPKETSNRLLLSGPKHNGRQLPHCVLGLEISIQWHLPDYPNPNVYLFTTPLSGNGTIVNSYGGMWNYTYNGTETTTTTTTAQVNLLYTDTSNYLYAYSYNQRGILVSSRWRAVTVRQGGDGANTLGYNLGSALASIHIKERLLQSAVEDISKTEVFSKPVISDNCATRAILAARRR
jgi:hypothetical protein